MLENKKNVELLNPLYTLEMKQKSFLYIQKVHVKRTHVKSSIY